jgi:heme/copper-type cytochrome/quinol oxidase subunit 4
MHKKRSILDTVGLLSMFLVIGTSVIAFGTIRNSHVPTREELFFFGITWIVFEICMFFILKRSSQTSAYIISGILTILLVILFVSGLSM